jgi:hypothetical protein
MASDSQLLEKACQCRRLAAGTDVRTREALLRLATEYEAEAQAARNLPFPHIGS